MKELISKADEFLYKHLQESNIDEKEKKYRYEHSLRVTNIGIELVKKEGANLKVAVLGCLLHDVGKFDAEANIDHGRASAKVAREFLKTLDLTEKEIDDICYAIAVHVDGKAGYEYGHIIEAGIVSDSDNIDRFAAYRMYEMMKFDQKEEMDREERIKKLDERLDRFKKYHKEGIMETESGNQWFREHLELGIDYFENYKKQLQQTMLPCVELGE